MGLRPSAQTTSQQMPSNHPVNNDYDSDEEVKKMSEGTKKYMNQHIAKATPNQANSRKQGMRSKFMNKNAVLPPNYVCHRCRQKGHLISDCPTNGNPDFDLKKTPKGIPKNLKKENLYEQVEDKFIKTIVNDEINYFDAKSGIMTEFQCTL